MSPGEIALLAEDGLKLGSRTWRPPKIDWGDKSGVLAQMDEAHGEQLLTERHNAMRRYAPSESEDL